MEELASILLHSRNQAHIFHLGVKGPGSHAAHLALQAYYEGIIPLVDGLVEGYQGKYGIIKFKSVNSLETESDMKTILSYFQKLSAIVEKLKKEEKLQDSWIQNDIDTVLTLVYSTLYKLKNLQ